jgi:hypothetical protein
VTATLVNAVMILCVPNIAMNFLAIYEPVKLNSVALVRERTIPTERPPLVGEVSANFCLLASQKGPCTMELVS